MAIVFAIILAVVFFFINRKTQPSKTWMKTIIRYLLVTAISLFLWIISFWICANSCGEMGCFACLGVFIFFLPVYFVVFSGLSVLLKTTKARLLCGGLVILIISMFLFGSGALDKYERKTAVETKNLFFCKIMTDDTLKSDCYFDLINKTHNEKICEEPFLKNRNIIFSNSSYCYQVIALANDDISLCAKATSDCYQTLESEVGQSHLCSPYFGGIFVRQIQDIKRETMGVPKDLNYGFLIINSSDRDTILSFCVDDAIFSNILNSSPTIQKGDIVLEIEGKKVSTINVLKMFEITNTPLKVKILRDGKIQELTIVGAPPILQK